MIKKFTIHFLISLMLIAPAFSLAADIVDNDTKDPIFSSGESLVPCGHVDSKGDINNPCSFGDALNLIDAVIKFILFKLALPIAAVMFFYAGFLMVTSGGSAESKTKAKNIFTNAVIGLVLAAGAWLIIRTILLILGYDGGWIGFTK